MQFLNLLNKVFLFYLICNLLLINTALSDSNIPTKNKAATTKPLFFPASKNGLKVLPQRFEYTLIDKSSLRIGDIHINTNEISFNIQNIKGAKQLVFTWPAALFSQGNLVLKNNNGKAVYSRDFEPKDISKIKNSNQTTEDDSDEKYRTDIAQLTSGPIEESLLESLKYMPFMSICVFREFEDTLTSLCSNELYIGTDSGKIIVKSRDSNKRNAYVDINGKIVGNQGLIFLNDRSENINFKAQMQSGASLEISTRMKEVDFKDVIFDTNNNKLVLTASGAEPINEDRITRMPNNEWQTQLSVSRPKVWLKGDGDIPMRQEFYIQGEVPSASDRVFVSAKSQDRFYGSSNQITGITRSEISVASKEANSQVIGSKKPNQFIWEISDFPSNIKTRRYLDVISGKNTFSAAMDFTRGTPYRLKIGSGINLPNESILANFQFQKWFEDFLNLNNPISKFRWGIEIEHSLLLSKKEASSKISETNLRLMYRLNPGFQSTDETWGLGGVLKMLQIEDSNNSLLGLSFFGLRKTPNVLSQYGQFYDVKFDYFLGTNTEVGINGVNTSISGVYTIESNLIYKLKNNWNLSYGLGYSSITGAPKRDDFSNLKILAGAIVNF